MEHAAGNPFPGPFKTGWFLLQFACIYAVLHALYFAMPDRVLREDVHYYGIVAPGARLIKLLAPSEQVVAVEGTLQSPHATLNIVRGCDSAGVAFLLIAAVVAFPAGWSRKLGGIVGALALTYVLNEIRVVLLYFVASYRHDWFSLLHNYLMPTFIIAVSCISFAWWAAWSALPRRSDAGPALEDLAL
jgi:exosortase family protein XrtM